MIIKNKKSKYNYDFIEEETAGIILEGTEIKSIRDGKVNFTDSYCYFNKNELWLKNLHIDTYKMGTDNNHEPKRDRKLLLTKSQLKKLEEKSNEKGLTIIPVSLFINDKGIVKIKIALAKGKKNYDKRLSIMNKDLKRDQERELKNKNY